jgi:hypothetical protein
MIPSGLIHTTRQSRARIQDSAIGLYVEAGMIGEVGIEMTTPAESQISPLRREMTKDRAVMVD